MKCFSNSLAQTWHQQLYQNRPTNFENWGPGGGTPSDRPMGYLPGSDEKAIKFYSCGSWAVLVASWERLGGVLGPSWAALGSQLGSQNGANLGKKSIQKYSFLDASWNLFLGWFWWILGAKMEPSWHQHGIKNLCLLGRAIFQNSCSCYSAGGPQRVPHRTVRWGTPLGLDCKNGLQVGMHLVIDFSLIFVVFGRQVGKQNVQKSIQKSINKLSNNNCFFIDFCLFFWGILVLKSDQNSINKSIKSSTDFWFDFEWILGGFLEYFGSSNAFKNRLNFLMRF